MINLPERFGKNIRTMIEKYREANGIERPDMKDVYDSDQIFFEEELNYITSLNLNSADVRYLQYFKNLKTLVIDSFPSVSDGAFKEIAMTCPNIVNLAIKNQAALKRINITPFKYLRNLSVVSNEHLVSIVGLEEKKLDSFEFYDNVLYEDINSIMEYSVKPQNDMVRVNIDALYYGDAMKVLANNIADYDEYKNYLEERFIWSEKLGFREQRRESYSTGQLQVAYENACDVVHKYVNENASDEEKFTSLYLWLQKYIVIESKRNLHVNEGIVNSFLNKKSNPQSYAKVLQFLLRQVNVESFDINTFSLENSDKYYLSPDSYCSIPSDDYFVLRTKLNGVYNYSDIAWDAVIAQATGEFSAHFYLLNKDGIMRNHRIIGEMAIENEEAISDDIRTQLVENGIKRLNEAERVVESSYSYDPNPELMNTEMNIECTKLFLEEIKKDLLKLPEDSSEYRKKAMEVRRIEKKIKNESIMFENLKSLISGLERNKLDSDKNYVQTKLGINITPYIFSESGEILKSHSELELEKKRLIKHINAEKAVGLLSVQTCSKLISKVEYIYNSYLSMANNDNLEFGRKIDRFDLNEMGVRKIA